MTCQRHNGGCDHICSDADIGVHCSCRDGYQLVDNQTCTGTQVTLAYMLFTSRICVKTLFEIVINYSAFTFTLWFSWLKPFKIKMTKKN